MIDNLQAMIAALRGPAPQEGVMPLPGTPDNNALIPGVNDFQPSHPDLMQVGNSPTSIPQEYLHLIGDVIKMPFPNGGKLTAASRQYENKTRDTTKPDDSTNVVKIIK